jgi:DNA polymerase-3 subunit alpha
MKKFVYKECGCSFDILKEASIPNINFDLDINNINLQCSKTWRLLSDGNTKGCFQLESRLGQSLAKQLKPSNIEELSALVSIMRPGCLEAIRNNKSVTNHYIDKKNGQESIDYFHPELEPILKNTYGEMIYQEQAMQIAQEIADFDLQEADMLRKAIGKKKPEEMSKLKQRFIDGIESKKSMTSSEAEELFSWIEKSQRYSFNKSHAISYAFNAFLSAYAKAHFPKFFFTSYLIFAKDKIDPHREIRELVSNAKEMGINIQLPDIRLKNENFMLHNNSIYFGLTNIKGFGYSVFNKFLSLIQDVNLGDLGFTEMYLRVLKNLNSSAVKNMILSGAISYINPNRKYLISCINALELFTKKESEKILMLDLNKYSKTEDLLSYILTLETGRQGILSSSKRFDIIKNALNLLDNPPYSLEDNAEWIADNEYSILGTAISCSKVDECDQMGANATCSQFNNMLSKDTINIACEISDIKITKTKKGKMPGSEMAFLTISDSTGTLNSVICFPEQYLNYKDLIQPTNTVVVSGNKNKSGDALIIKKIWQI